MTREELCNLTPAQVGLHIQAQRDRNKRDDYRFARVCAVLAEIHRDKKERIRPFEVDEFMPKYEQPQTAEQINRRLDLWSKLAAE